MLEICFGTYLILGLPAMLFLSAALAVSRTHRQTDQQRFYQITLAMAGLKNTLRDVELLEDQATA
jgi:hypothetical protein